MTAPHEPLAARRARGRPVVGHELRHLRCAALGRHRLGRLGWLGSQAWIGVGIVIGGVLGVLLSTSGTVGASQDRPSRSVLSCYPAGHHRRWHAQPQTRSAASADRRLLERRGSRRTRRERMLAAGKGFEAPSPATSCSRRCSARARSSPSRCSSSSSARSLVAAFFCLAARNSQGRAGQAAVRRRGGLRLRPQLASPARPSGTAPQVRAVPRRRCSASSSS